MNTVPPRHPQHAEAGCLGSRMPCPLLSLAVWDWDMQLAALERHLQPDRNPAAALPSPATAAATPASALPAPSTEPAWATAALRITASLQREGTCPGDIPGLGGDEPLSWWEQAEAF